MSTQGHPVEGSHIEVAAVQLATREQPIERNLARIADAVRTLAQREVRLAVFPELCLTGYLAEPVAALAIPRDDDAVETLRRLAAEHGMVLVVGFIELADDGATYNSALVIDADGSDLGAYRKTHLFGDESTRFSSGSSLEVFDTAVGRVGVLICYDLEFPEVARALVLRGAEILAIPSANMHPYAQHHALYVRCRALENGVHCVMANTAGEDARFRYVGESAVIDAAGRVLGRAGAEETTVVSNVALGAESKDPALRYAAYRRPELYRQITQPDVCLT